ncbi:hypothetical protein G7Y89_g7236 [Cudoniella acicularis]|uniref:Major facilitator superfamily (MFS) profile domain-containing protein n=1 Tax=Cudoniella acicularis TaxID=354080 RepID=A0A8H4RKH8_9HELO|nr:hypothetical protein G7Y89_g7236 [Cudoniella acicularis]
MAATRPEFSSRAPTQISDDSSEHVQLSRLTTWKTSEESDIQDGGYGWIVVGSIFLINAHSWGMTGSYAVFLAYYLSHDTYPGATSLDYAMIGGLSFSTAFLVAPLVNFCVKALGSKPTLCIGILFQAAGFIGASFATEIWHLFLSQGVSLGIGIGFMFDATAGIIPQWFTKGRAFANGLASGGSGTGGMIYSLATFAMVPRLGLAWTFRTLAIIQFVVCGVCTLLLKDRNREIGSSLASFDIKLLKRLEFILLLGWAFFSLLGYVTLLFSLPNWATTINLTASQGSIINAMANLAQAISRPLIGHFADKAGCLTISTFGTVLAGLTCLLFWPFVEDFTQAVIFALMSGAVTGTFFTLIAPVCARVVGLVELPAGLAVMQRSSGRVYLNVQVFAGAMFLAAAVCLFFVRRWKIAEVVRIEKEEGRLEEQVGNDSSMSSQDALTTESKPVSKWRRCVKRVAKFCAFEKV